MEPSPHPHHCLLHLSVVPWRRKRARRAPHRQDQSQNPLPTFRSESGGGHFWSSVYFCQLPSSTDRREGISVEIVSRGLQGVGRPPCGDCPCRLAKQSGRTRLLLARACRTRLFHSAAARLQRRRVETHIELSGCNRGAWLKHTGRFSKILLFSMRSARSK